MATVHAARRIRKIAILGGSFDPPTDGHLHVAAGVVQTKAADEVWMMPCGKRPDKPTLKTSVRSF
jgi:nicotinic acid mononucleotide adenylyltransferase